MKRKKKWIFLFFLFITMTTCSIPEIIHKNKGQSISTGSVRNGKLENGWLFPYSGKNYHYFSLFSYYILNCAYMHHDVHAVLTDAYKTCETTCPGKEFILMECTKRKGGNMIFHWTHENGTSVDFMVPVLKGANQNVWPNKTGLAHYLLKFDENGRFTLGKNIRIDFETMARHLIALDDEAKKNGIRIRKVLFHTDLHEELFSTPSGKILAERDLNFIPHLSNLINKLHDDHYHVDFDL